MRLIRLKTLYNTMAWHVNVRIHCWPGLLEKFNQDTLFHTPESYVNISHLMTT